MASVTIHHGDGLDVLRSMEDRLGGMAIVTDPPYGLGDKWKGGNAASKGKWPLSDGGANTQWDRESVPWLEEWVAKFRYAIVWGGHYYRLPPMRGWLIWDKLVRKFTTGHCEMAWTNLDQPVRAFNYATAQLATEHKIHPTQKPLPLMVWCLGFLPERVTVVDPFMGSGTTGMACKQEGFDFIGVEKDPKYVEGARRRLAGTTVSMFATPAE